MRGRTFTTVGWEKYLNPIDNPFVQNFLHKNGNEVFDQIALNINTAILQKKESIAFVVHTNASSVVVIEKKDYEVVLNHCLDWFIKKENYEFCSRIEEFKQNLNNSKQSIPRFKNKKTLI